MIRIENVRIFPAFSMLLFFILFSGVSQTLSIEGFLRKNKKALKEVETKKTSFSLIQPKTS